MTTPASTLLRQLFPSWEFFDVARVPPTLQLRLLSSRGDPTEWLEVVRASPRRWWHVLFNPAGTRTLAAQTLVERWYTELAELGGDALACRESLALVTALAKGALAEGHPVENAGWQFRLVVLDEDDGSTDVVYESDRLPRAVARVAP